MFNPIKWWRQRQVRKWQERRQQDAKAQARAIKELCDTAQLPPEALFIPGDVARELRKLEARGD